MEMGFDQLVTTRISYSLYPSQTVLLKVKLMASRVLYPNQSIVLATKKVNPLLGAGENLLLKHHLAPS